MPIHVGNLRCDRDRYTFDVSLGDVTLRNVYYRIEAGEFGFPAQQQANLDAQTCQTLSEALLELVASLPALAREVA